MSKTIILGAGMAGLGARYRLNSEGFPSDIFEKNTYPGGHTASFKNEFGFIFDEGPHISFTKDERIQKLFAESVNEDYQTLNTSVNNYWKGQYWIKHPAQCNLYGLPTDLVVQILQDFVHAKNTQPGEIKNYADWLLASYGKAFAETFPMQYGLKYHTTQANNMSIEWLGPRLYQPNFEELFRGALTSQTPDVHYISNFRYPTNNGFVSYLKPFMNGATIHVSHKLCKLDPKKHELQFTNGVVEHYDHLISSIPLPALIPMIKGVPVEVKEAAKKLACTTCVIVNVGLNREDISPAHWSYFYDHDFSFTRLSFPHMLSPHNVPAGKGSIQAEVYYSKKYRPLDRKPEDCIAPVLQDLRRCGLLHEEEEVLFAEASLIPYANIIFDLERSDALACVHGYLDEIKLGYCGRYGNWGYEWTDESFKSGEDAAQKIIDNITSPSSPTA